MNKFLREYSYGKASSEPYKHTQTHVCHHSLWPKSPSSKPGPADLEHKPDGDLPITNELKDHTIWISGRLDHPQFTRCTWKLESPKAGNSCLKLFAAMAPGTRGRALQSSMRLNYRILTYESCQESSQEGQQGFEWPGPEWQQNSVVFRWFH